MAGFTLNLNSEMVAFNVLCCCNVTHFILIQTLDLLQRLCELRHYKFLRLDGSTAVDRRLELVDRFNNGYCNESKWLTDCILHYLINSTL